MPDTDKKKSHKQDKQKKSWATVSLQWRLAFPRLVCIHHCHEINQDGWDTSLDRKDCLDLGDLGAGAVEGRYRAAPLTGVPPRGC